SATAARSADPWPTATRPPTSRPRSSPSTPRWWPGGPAGSAPYRSPTSSPGSWRRRSTRPRCWWRSASRRRPERGGATRSSPAGRSTGRSSAWRPSTTGRPVSPSSTWVRHRCGPRRWRRRSMPERARRTPPPSPPRAPNRRPTSTPAPTSAATWPGSWSAGPWKGRASVDTPQAAAGPGQKVLRLHVVGVLEQATADQHLGMGLDGVHHHRTADLVDVVQAEVEHLVAAHEAVELGLVGEEVVGAGKRLSQGPAHLSDRPHAREPVPFHRVGRQRPELFDPVLHLKGSGGQVALGGVLHLELVGGQGGVHVDARP